MIVHPDNRPRLAGPDSSPFLLILLLLKWYVLHGELGGTRLTGCAHSPLEESLLRFRPHRSLYGTVCIVSRVLVESLHYGKGNKRKVCASGVGGVVDSYKWLSETARVTTCNKMELEKERK